MRERQANPNRFDPKLTCPPSLRFVASRLRRAAWLGALVLAIAMTCPPAHAAPCDADGLRFGTPCAVAGRQNAHANGPGVANRTGPTIPTPNHSTRNTP